MGIPALDDQDVFALATRATLPNQVARLVLLVSRSLDAKMQLAIGGAVAVRDAGFGRHTDDLDVFARPVSAKRLVKALRAAGMKTFWITDAHAVAYLEEDNMEAIAAREAPSVRIDILSTVTEPEAGAIRTAVPPKRLGVPVKVMRPDHLAAIKYLAGRPKDMMDFDELVRLGVDLERVRYLVAMTDAAKATAMIAHARSVLKPRGVREPQSRYLDREGFQRAWAEALRREEAPAS